MGINDIFLIIYDNVPTHKHLLSAIHIGYYDLSKLHCRCIAIRIIIRVVPLPRTRFELFYRTSSPKYTLRTYITNIIQNNEMEVNIAYCALAGIDK